MAISHQKKKKKTKNKNLIMYKCVLFEITSEKFPGVSTINTIQTLLLPVWPSLMFRIIRS